MKLNLLVGKHTIVVPASRMESYDFHESMLDETGNCSNSEKPHTHTGSLVVRFYAQDKTTFDFNIPAVFRSKFSGDGLEIFHCPYLESKPELMTQLVAYVNGTSEGVL